MQIHTKLIFKSTNGASHSTGFNAQVEYARRPQLSTGSRDPTPRGCNVSNLQEPAAAIPAGESPVGSHDAPSLE